MRYCSNCANRHTPLCDTCLSIEHPSRKASEPSMFCNMPEIETDHVEWKKITTKETVQALEKIIRRHLEEGVPIPVCVVLSYNKIKEV